MLNLGFGEMVLLAVIALVVIGPKQLPTVARTIGRVLNELKRTTSEFTRTFTEVADSTTKALRLDQPPAHKPDEIKQEQEHGHGDGGHSNHAHHGYDPHTGQPFADDHLGADHKDQMSFDLTPQTEEPKRKDS